MKLFENLKARQIARPYIIAEAGVNHEGSMEIAKRIIEEAKEGGADAVKFQSYKAETLAMKNSPAYWDLSLEPTTSQYDLFRKHDKFWKKEFEALKEYCQKVDIEFLSTPFDLESAKFLQDLQPMFKISSSDLTNYPFIKYICQFGKPIILSTGAANLDEIKEVVELIGERGNPLALLHCILNYPTVDQQANLGMILSLKNNFPDLVIGYSDHTLPGNMKNLEIAVLLGAKIIEKHFTHDKNLPGNDHYHSMDKEDLKLFNRNLEKLFSIIGSLEKYALPSEEISRKNARRSLVSSKRINQGEIISADCLTWKRPAFGISPKDIDLVIGKKASRDIAEDELITTEHFD